MWSRVQNWQGCEMTRPYSMSPKAIHNVIVREQTTDKYFSAQAQAMLTCASIREYFTTEMWNAWVDAGPEDVFKFVEYALTEQEAITAELARVAEWLAPTNADLHDADRAAWEEFVAETEATRRSDYPI